MRLEKTGAYGEAVRSILSCSPASSPREIHEGLSPLRPPVFPQSGLVTFNTIFLLLAFPTSNYPVYQELSYTESYESPFISASQPQ